MEGHHQKGTRFDAYPRRMHAKDRCFSFCIDSQGGEERSPSVFGCLVCSSEGMASAVILVIFF